MKKLKLPSKKGFAVPESDQVSFVGSGQGRGLTGAAKGLRASQSSPKGPGILKPSKTGLPV